MCPKPVAMCCLPALTCLLLVPMAQAEFFNNAAGLPSPVRTITFDEHPRPFDTVITDQYADVGITFSPRVYQDLIRNDFNGITGPRVGNSNGDGALNPFSLRLTERRTAAAFALVSNTSTMTFTALLNGTEVDSGSAFSSTTNPINFYGFTGVTFDEIRIFQQVQQFRLGVLMDSIQLGPIVPSPASLYLFAASAMGALYRRRSFV